MNISLPYRRLLNYCLFLCLIFVLPLTSKADNHRIYVHFIGDSITKGMLNNSSLNSNRISEYGGYRGELFQYLQEMSQQPQKAGWPKIQYNATGQLTVIGENGIKYELLTLGANITPTDKQGPYQVNCDDKNYLICQYSNLYAYNDGRSGETSAQLLSALATGKWPLFPFYRDYKIQADSELLTTILLGTNDLIQGNDANTANNIKAIVDASIDELQTKITRFAFVISTIPDAEAYAEKGYSITQLKSANTKNCP